MIEHRSKIAVLLLVGSAGTPFIANAQEVSQPAPLAEDQAGEAVSTDIVVTAQRREQRLVEVPITINSVSGSDLEAANIRNVSELARVAPSLIINKNGAATEVALRGVTSRTTENSVATYVDGVYNPSKISMNLDFNNVDRVDVLKGPQGTLFGRNATGGAILITTRTPSQDTVLEASLGLEQRDGYMGSLYASTGIAENLAIDLSVNYRQTDGWLKEGGIPGMAQPIPVGTNLAPLRQMNIRTKAQWTPTEDLTVVLSYENGRVEDASTLVKAISQYGTSGNPVALDTAYLSYVPFNKATWNAVTARVDYETGPVRISSITGWRDEHNPLLTDVDNQLANIVRVTWDARQRSFSQEFNVASTTDGPFEWVAGAFYYSDSYDIDWNIAGGTFNARMDTTAVAPFLDLTYHVTPKLSLIAGARYSAERRTLDYTRPLTGTPVVQFTKLATYSNFSPRAVARYEINDDTNIYASFTQGFKSGIFNTAGSGLTGPTSPGAQPLEPETLDAYELGFKTSANGLSVSLAGFFYDQKNIQVSRFTGTETLIQNAAAGRIYGAEAQLAYRVNSDFNISLNGAYTHARYASFTNLSASVPIDPSNPASPMRTVSQDVSGQQMLRSPTWTGNFFADYTIPTGVGDITASGNIYFTSSYASATPQLDPVSGKQSRRTDGYALLNLSLTWRPTDQISVQGFVRNATNKRYFPELDASSFGYLVTYAEPRTFGAKVGFKL